MDTSKFKLKLEEEKQKLEEQLSQVGRRNPTNPEDWEPQFSERNEQASAQDEMADKFEDMEQTLALQNTYETRLTAVRDALERIENGTYGKCKCCNALLCTFLLIQQHILQYLVLLSTACFNKLLIFRCVFKLITNTIHTQKSTPPISACKILVA